MKTIGILWLDGMDVREHLKLSNTSNGVYVAQSDFSYVVLYIKCCSTVIRAAPCFWEKLPYPGLTRGWRGTWPGFCSRFHQTHRLKTTTGNIEPWHHCSCATLQHNAYELRMFGPSENRHGVVSMDSQEEAVVVLLILSRSQQLSGQNKWYAFCKLTRTLLSLLSPSYCSCCFPARLISTFHRVGHSVQLYLWLD